MIQPLRDVILIKADKAQKSTDSGLLISEDWKTLPLTGTVLAIGPQVTDVAIGDRVGFARYASIILPDDERLCNQRHLIWRF